VGKLHYRGPGLARSDLPSTQVKAERVRDRLRLVKGRPGRDLVVVHARVER
jgi:hypothetical protein